MSLTNVYVQVYGQFPDFFQRISDGQAPQQFTQQHLKDLGFASSNHRALIPLLKALGFLSADGTPTARYHAYRDKSQAPKIMAEAVREAYADLFVIKSNPTETDRALIEGKFKSAHNATDRVAKLMANTFFGLLALADFSTASPRVENSTKQVEEVKENQEQAAKPTTPVTQAQIQTPTLHYNIQIHLPATKDIEVFNAIFKSLKEHLLQ